MAIGLIASIITIGTAVFGVLVFLGVIPDLPEIRKGAKDDYQSTIMSHRPRLVLQGIDLPVLEFEADSNISNVKPYKRDSANVVHLFSEIGLYSHWHAEFLFTFQNQSDEDAVVKWILVRQYDGYHTGLRDRIVASEVDTNLIEVQGRPRSLPEERVVPPGGLIQFLWEVDLSYKGMSSDYLFHAVLPYQNAAGNWYDTYTWFDFTAIFESSEIFTDSSLLGHRSDEIPPDFGLVVYKDYKLQIKASNPGFAYDYDQAVRFRQFLEGK